MRHHEHRLVATDLCYAYERSKLYDFLLITLKHVPNDEWYYWLTVVYEFIEEWETLSGRKRNRKESR